KLSFDITHFLILLFSLFFFFNDSTTTEIYTLSLHDALPISGQRAGILPRPLLQLRKDLIDLIDLCSAAAPRPAIGTELEIFAHRSEEHTSELQSHLNLVCRLLLEKKKKQDIQQP